MNGVRVVVPRMRTALVLVLLLALAAPGQAAPPGKRWKVGMAGAPPFVLDSKDAPPAGLAVDVWQAVAYQLKIEYDLVMLPDYESAVDAMAEGRIDALIGSIAITADRARRVAFTQPIFRTGVGILTPPRTGSVWERAQPLLQNAFFAAVGTLGALLLVVGVLVWLAERRENPEHFPRSLLPGVANGMWLALVTMTTVGFGDRVPTTAAGRGVVSLWMLISMIFASTLTAGLATAFTLFHIPDLQIEDPSQLAGRRVGVLHGSFVVPWVQAKGGRVIPVESLGEGAELVQQDHADAFVLDEPSLRWFVAQNPRLPLRLAAGGWDDHNFGFAVPLDSPALHALNVALLELAESGELKRMEHQWLGAGEE